MVLAPGRGLGAARGEPPMLNWLRKRLGIHVYEEFTQWETHQQKFTRPTSVEVDGTLALRREVLEWTERWQDSATQTGWHRAGTLTRQAAFGGMQTRIAPRTRGVR